jgi:hypothetical protein
MTTPVQDMVARAIAGLPSAKQPYVKKTPRGEAAGYVKEGRTQIDPGQAEVIRKRYQARKVKRRQRFFNRMERLKLAPTDIPRHIMEG